MIYTEIALQETRLNNLQVTLHGLQMNGGDLLQVAEYANQIRETEQRLSELYALVNVDPEPQRWAADQMLPRDNDPLGTKPLRRG